MTAIASQKVTAPLPLDQERAAELVADDEHSDVEIAKIVGVTRRTLARWKKTPAFSAAVQELRESFRERMLQHGFADRARRVQGLNTVATALLMQISQADYQVLLKTTDEGEPIYGFDDRRVAQFRGCLDDIAKEMQERGTASASATATAAVVVKVYTDARMDNPLEADWSDAPPPRSSADA